MGSAEQAVVLQDGESFKVVCGNCKSYFPPEDVTVKRWREDGNIAQAVCRPCGAVATRVARQGGSLGLLSTEQRLELFSRARESGVDAKALLDELTVTTESHELSSADGRKGNYERVDKLAETSPYKSNPAALKTLLDRSYTLEGLDGLQRVWVPEYTRNENDAHARKTSKETSFSQRSTAPKAKPKAVGAARGGARRLQDTEAPALAKYSKTTQTLLKKTQTELEKASSDLSTAVFVLSSEEAHDFTSKQSLTVGNQCVRDLVAYLTSLKDGVQNHEDENALKKKATDCQETLKESKKTLKKLQGDMADLPANLRDTLLGRKDEADLAEAQEEEGQKDEGQEEEPADQRDTGGDSEHANGNSRTASTPTAKASGKRAAPTSASSSASKKPAAKT